MSEINKSLNLKTIAYIHTDFKSKFGIPRQSGLVDSLKGTIIFEPEYRDYNALRGLEEFSHIWIIWEFSENVSNKSSPTVRSPRFGDNKKMGVFATRSPYRPNPIGISCVKLDCIKLHPKRGYIIQVLGADLMDKTPIYDIKPYIPYTDSHPDAFGGYAETHKREQLKVEFPKKWLNIIPKESRDPLIGVLAQDPRLGYKEDPQRVYGFVFSNYDVRFTVAEDVVEVQEIVKL